MNARAVAGPRAFRSDAQHDMGDRPGVAGDRLQGGEPMEQIEDDGAFPGHELDQRHAPIPGDFPEIWKVGVRRFAGQGEWARDIPSSGFRENFVATSASEWDNLPRTYVVHSPTLCGYVAQSDFGQPQFSVA